MSMTYTTTTIFRTIKSIVTDNDRCYKSHVLRIAVFFPETLDLCQYKSENISCKVGQKIKMDTIEQYLLEHTSCHIIENPNCSSDFTNIRKKCDGNTSCTLTGMDFSTGICKVYPRYIGVSYTCLKQSKYIILFRSGK